MAHVYLLIGGNTGNRIKYLKNAVEMISRETGRVKKTSSIYETEPFGFRDKNQFLNICVLIETDFSPHEVLRSLSEIETQLGRIRKSEKFVSRTIDIDILFYDNIILDDPDLVIPHPEIHKRNFVLIPMAEIAPEYIHPVSGKTISDLLEKSADIHKVSLYQGKLG